MRQWINIVEDEFRSKSIEDFIPENNDLDDIKSEFLPDWEMLDHKTLQAKFVAKDHRHALQFIKFINSLSEKMDHFAEVTQDVAEVTVKTSTFDVKGLTILDFKLAVIVDKYAEKNDIDQVRMQGNFGMHESAKKGLYYYVNKRKKAGTSRSKNSPSAPSKQDWKNAAKTAKK